MNNCIHGLCPVNHCPIVKETFAAHDITMIPSSVRFHEVKNCSPPTSHDLSVLDGNLFAQLQSKASRNTLKVKSSKQSETCELMDQTKKIWLSKEYKSRARRAVEKLPNALKAVLKAKGGPTGR